MKTFLSSIGRALKMVLLLVNCFSLTISYAQTSSRWAITDTTTRTYGYGYTLYNGDVLINTNSNKYSVYEFRTNSWKVTGNNQKILANTSYVNLNNNAILAVGQADLLTPYDVTEIYNPQTGLWFRAGNTNYFWVKGKKLNLLSTGEVLLLGDGIDYTAPPTNKCELFDPVSLSWSIPDSMNFKRAKIWSTVTLPNGKLLVGGSSVNGVKSFETYNPVTKKWQIFPAPYNGVNRFILFVTKNGRLFLFEEGLKTEEFNFSTNSWQAINFGTQIYNSDNLFELDNGNLLQFSVYPPGYAQEIEINTGAVVKRDTLPFIPASVSPYRLELRAATMHKMGNGKYLVAGGDGLFYVQSDLTFEASKYSFIYTPDFMAKTEKEKEEPVTNGLAVYPNPSSGEFTLRYTLDQEVEPVFSVYNTLGELVQTIKPGYKEKGAHSQSVVLQGACGKTGVYFCVMTTSRSIKTIKINVLR